MPGAHRAECCELCARERQTTEQGPCDDDDGSSGIAFATAPCLSYWYSLLNSPCPLSYILLCCISGACVTNELSQLASLPDVNNNTFTKNE